MNSNGISRLGYGSTGFDGIWRHGSRGHELALDGQATEVPSESSVGDVENQRPTDA